MIFILTFSSFGFFENLKNKELLWFLLIWSNKAIDKSSENEIKKIEIINSKHISSYRRLSSNNLQMYTQIHSPSTSPKNLAFIPRSNFTTQADYKERANILFDKLNSFKNNLEN